MPSGAGGLQWPPVRGRLMGSLRCNDTAFLADCSQDLDVAKHKNHRSLLKKNMCSTKFSEGVTNHIFGAMIIRIWLKSIIP